MVTDTRYHGCITLAFGKVHSILHSILHVIPCARLTDTCSCVTRGREMAWHVPVMWSVAGSLTGGGEDESTQDVR